MEGVKKGDTIKVFRDESGAWRWNRVASNGERVATSGEDFDTKGNAIRAAEREANGEIAVEVADE
jgi:uncharacterized protein YegP (UPF0339 family)